MPDYYSSERRSISSPLSIVCELARHLQTPEDLVLIGLCGVKATASRSLQQFHEGGLTCRRHRATPHNRIRPARPTIGLLAVLMRILPATGWVQLRAGLAAAPSSITPCD